MTIAIKICQSSGKRIASIQCSSITLKGTWYSISVLTKDQEGIYDPGIERVLVGKCMRLHAVLRCTCQWALHMSPCNYCSKVFNEVCVPYLYIVILWTFTSNIYTFGLRPDTMSRKSMKDMVSWSSSDEKTWQMRLRKGLTCTWNVHKGC